MSFLKPKVPKGLQAWPERETGLSSDDIILKYEQGYAGCIYDEAARELLLSEMDEPDGEKVASTMASLTEPKMV